MWYSKNFPSCSLLKYACVCVRVRIMDLRHHDVKTYYSVIYILMLSETVLQKVHIYSSVRKILLSC